MNTREQIKKLANLLNGKTIYFDWKSYDFEEDIPHLFLDDKRKNISSVSIGEDGLTMNVMTTDCEYGLGFYEDIDNGNTFETIDKELEEIGMDEFLRDIYYEHPRSWEIGDYENDFLAWDENSSTEETEKEEEEGKAQTYRIAVTNVEYGFIDVVATSLDEAMEKVESFDGDYYVNKNTITHTELIEVLDK
jgi:hypothetical protein